MHHITASSWTQMYVIVLRRLVLTGWCAEQLGEHKLSDISPCRRKHDKILLSAQCIDIKKANEGHFSSLFKNRPNRQPKRGSLTTLNYPLITESYICQESKVPENLCKTKGFNYLVVLIHTQYFRTDICFPHSSMQHVTFKTQITSSHNLLLK